MLRRTCLCRRQTPARRARLARWALIPLLGIGAVAPAFAADVKENYPDGKIKVLYHTDAKDQKTGTYEEFYSSGKVKVRGQYVLGKKSGLWITYNELGKVLESAGYRADQLEGGYQWNFPTGKPELRATYHQGMLVGPLNVLDDNGNTVRRVNYPHTLDAVEKAFSTLYYNETTPVSFTTEPQFKSPYKAGALSPDSLDAALKLTRLYRFLCGAPSQDMKVDAALNDKSAHGAVLLAKGGMLTHKPERPEDMDKGFYEIAYTGCSEANLYEGSTKPCDAIRGFMDDSDRNNVEMIGHRQWLLSPGLQKVGFGAAKKFVSMYVFDGNRPAKVDYNYIAFPGEGYFPRKLLDAQSVWSLHLNSAKARLTIKDLLKVSVHKLDAHYQAVGDEIAAKVISTPTPSSPAFGWDVVVFQPDFVVMDAGRYWVEVKGVQTPAGVAVPFGYLVELVDVADPDRPKAVATTDKPVELTPAEKAKGDMTFAKSLLGKTVPDMQFAGMNAKLIQTEQDGLSRTFRLLRAGDPTVITVHTNPTGTIDLAEVDGQIAKP